MDFRSVMSCIKECSTAGGRTLRSATPFNFELCLRALEISRTRTNQAASSAGSYGANAGVVAKLRDRAIRALELVV